MNIEIEINDKKEIVSPFNESVLNSEFHNYLISSCKFQKIDNITLIFKSNLNDQELKDVGDLIHNYYQNLYKKAKTVDNYDDYIRLFLFLLGIFSIILSKMFTTFLSELLLIAGWVFIWEIIYDLFFSSVKRKKEAKIYSKLANSSIKRKN